MTTSSRTRMLDAAEQLFRVQGLHATGLAEILERSDAPRGSLYHYFPGGKEQLAVEALRGAGERIAAAITDLFTAAGSGPAALRAYGNRASARLRDTDFREGCPIGNTLLEASVLSPAVRDVCDEALRTWEAVIANPLVQDGVERQQADALATVVVSTIEGALLVARARRSTQPMDDACEQLARLVEAARSS